MTQRKLLRAERDQRIAGMIGEGRGSREIMNATGCHSRDVARVREAAGVPTWKSRRVLTAALMLAGEKPYIAAALAGANKAVAYKLRNLGVANG
jgi:hypothetical protein